MRDGKVSGRVGKGDSDLYEFSFLDVMPEELILDIFRRVVEGKMMLFYRVAREFCVEGDDIEGLCELRDVGELLGEVVGPDIDDGGLQVGISFKLIVVFGVGVAMAVVFI